MRRKDVKKIFKMDNTCDSINLRSSLLLFFYLLGKYKFKET